MTSIPPDGYRYCPVCAGTGQMPKRSNIIVPGMSDLVYRFMTCVRCNGEGRIPIEQKQVKQ